jgi:hypothetical protein
MFGFGILLISGLFVLGLLGLLLLGAAATILWLVAIIAYLRRSSNKSEAVRIVSAIYILAYAAVLMLLLSKPLRLLRLRFSLG